MITVYIKEKPIHLTDSKGLKSNENEKLDFDTNPEKLSKLINAFESGSAGLDAAVVYSSNLKKL
jgi:hypothetical protein